MTAQDIFIIFVLSIVGFLMIAIPIILRTAFKKEKKFEDSTDSSLDSFSNDLNESVYNTNETVDKGGKNV